jgi:TRAP-type C4-dicarboxylate transport system permease small subunit
MTVITFVQVVSRYVFGVSFFWAEELARFSMIWIAFLGAAVGVSQKAHTRIDFFINLLPKPARKWVEIFDNLVCLVFVIIISYYSIGVIQITMKNLSTGLKVPMGIVYASLPISGVLMIIYFLIQIYLQVKDIDINLERQVD